MLVYIIARADNREEREREREREGERERGREGQTETEFNNILTVDTICDECSFVRGQCEGKLIIQLSYLRLQCFPCQMRPITSSGNVPLFEIAEQNMP